MNERVGEIAQDHANEHCEGSPFLLFVLTTFDQTLQQKATSGRGFILVYSSISRGSTTMKG